ncbi:MAG: N-acetyl-gamma-glutamyl-phosphate reductase [Lachnospiraceae bacterium]|nr:N-acetyl-gamma-glutamyl-phosphate reductase [Lachnospiraceae bacterium]
MIKAGIVGATGYAGAELVRILANHPNVEIAWLASKSYAGQKFSDIYQNMRGICDLVLEEEDLEAQADRADVIFTATPQGYLSQRLNEKILEKTKVIDISADYRIKDVATYEQWYGIEHGSPEFLDEAVYGLCEINRDQLTQEVRLVANPGCYTTCSILSLYPLVKAGVIENDTIVIDAKSGTSGAGRGAKTANLYCEVNESIKAYGVATHRHTPEIEEQLGYACGEDVVLNFTPHLVPMDRGILVTAYADLKVDEDGAIPNTEEIRAVYEEAYGKERFIRLLPAGVCAETRNVKGSNYVDIGFVIDERTGRIIVMAALDNLVKGAAGQAVQNMNLVFGLPEERGLEMVPLLP